MQNIVYVNSILEFLISKFNSANGMSVNELKPFTFTIFNPFQLSLDTVKFSSRVFNVVDEDPDFNLLELFCSFLTGSFKGFLALSDVRAGDISLKK